LDGIAGLLKFFGSILALLSPMKKKNELHYELYGSSGYWRWAIYAGREKKPLLVGSFSGTLDDAKEHAEAAILRLKQRAQKRKASPSK
jgi:hypothetical protein